VLGDAGKVRWTPLNAQQRFTALQSGEVDVLSRNTTWTLTRDASMGLHFTAIAYYDGQGFMVPKKLRITSIKQLKGAEICVQMDADLSHDPTMLPALVSVVEHGADLAIGSRYVPGGITLNWPRRRRWLSRWGNRYAAGVLGLAVNDVTAGYRAYRSTALERMEFDSVVADGYGFQIEMTYRLVRLGGKVVEFPITFPDRTEGESKMSGSIVSEALGLVLRLWVADFGGRRRRRKQGG
jgi:hypothetical protein